MKSKERELNTFKTLLKQTLTPTTATTTNTNNGSVNNGTSNGDGLNFNLNDIISQLNSTNPLNNSSLNSNGTDLFSLNSLSNFITNQQQQQQQNTNSNNNNNGNLSYLPKI